MRIVISAIVRRMVSRLSDASLFVVLVVLAVLLLVARSAAAQYEFNGVYKVVDVFTAYCEGCFLELPPEFLESEIVLAVKTDDERVFRRALTKSARGAGWDLSNKGHIFVASPLQNVDNLVFVSCISHEPVNVPKYLYHYARQADSIKCHIRDSLEAAERERLDKLDSLSRILLPFKSYRLEYYSYTRNFADKMGVEFNAVVASGDLRGKLKLYDDWKLYATQTNDTSYTFRSVDVSLDSSVSVDWGTEEQTLKTSYVTANGIVNTDYEWRKYGLLVSLSKDTSRVRMQYVFRDKEQNISVLQGQAVGTLGDTIRVSGQYNVSRSVVTGVPFLSSIPLLRYLFSTEQVLVDTKQFELYLIPKQ